MYHVCTNTTEVKSFSSSIYREVRSENLNLAGIYGSFPGTAISEEPKIQKINGPHSKGLGPNVTQDIKIGIIMGRIFTISRY